MLQQNCAQLIGQLLQAHLRQATFSLFSAAQDDEWDDKAVPDDGGGPDDELLRQIFSASHLPATTDCFPLQRKMSGRTRMIQTAAAADRTRCCSATPVRLPDP